MYRRVKQVAVFFDDDLGTADEKANRFLATLHEGDVVGAKHDIQYNITSDKIPPKVSILVTYRKPIKEF